MEELKSRLEIFQKGKLDYLDLSHLNLKELPIEIKGLNTVKRLKLIKNELEHLPDWIGEWGNLEELDLTSNKLKNIPAVVFKLKKLTRLLLSNNQISHLPKAIENLPKLERLFCTNNRLILVADEIGSLPSLKRLYLNLNMLDKFPDPLLKLTTLEVLDISSNNIKFIPEARNDEKMPFLERLYLSSNTIEGLPAWLKASRRLKVLYLKLNNFSRLPFWLSELLELQVLHLGDNAFEKVPFEIRYLRKLRELNLSFNGITELPEWMSELINLDILVLRNNKLNVISPQIFSLPKIKDINIKDYKKRANTLYLQNNPIETPPIEIISQGKEAVLNFFSSLDPQTSTELYEAKMLIVGSGGSGKTTLIKKIVDPAYKVPTIENRTHGIEITKFSFPVRLKDRGDEKEINTNIWDFGGQEIYHSTHQFFLTKRSLYILVADNRKEDADFDYWLHIINLLGSDSPIIIVLNEKDDFQKDINLKFLKSHFPNLLQAHKVNFATNRGLESLIAAIKENIKYLDHIGEPFPLQWMGVRNSLESERRNFISYEEFLEICLNNGLDEEKEARVLSQYLHDLGIILHFQDDIILENTIILNPRWSTRAVYMILDAPLVVENKGRFSLQELRKIWSIKEYPRNKHHELLQLMIRFQLCYKLDEQTYIAPQLLDSEQLTYNFPEKGLLNYQFHYKFLPKGIISRLIVLLNQKIENNIAWKNGFVIKESETIAEIVQDLIEKQIKIRIYGKRKKNYCT